MNILLSIFWLTFAYIYNEHKPGDGKFLSLSRSWQNRYANRLCQVYISMCLRISVVLHPQQHLIFFFSFYFCICWMATPVIIGWYFIMVIFCISLMAFHIYWSFVYPQNEVKWLSHVQLFATRWTVAYQAPPSLGFSRQEYWSGLPFPSTGDLHNQGFEPRSPTLQTDALPSEPPGKAQRGF